MDRLAEKALAAIEPISPYEVYGRVTKILGLLVEITGFGEDLSIDPDVFPAKSPANHLFARHKNAEYFLK